MQLVKTIVCTVKCKRYALLQLQQPWPIHCDVHVLCISLSMKMYGYPKKHIESNFKKSECTKSATISTILTMLYFYSK